MHKRLALLLVLLALAASCQKFAEGRQMFRDLLALRDQIATQFHDPVGNVTISNGDRLTITFVNSPLNAASEEARQKRADEVAAFVMSHYKHPVSSVTTVFLNQKGAGPVSISTSNSYVGHPAQTH